MRCAACHSYIPEGLPSPVVCPSCGKGAERAGPAAKDADATPATGTPRPARPEHRGPEAPTPDGAPASGPRHADESRPPATLGPAAAEKGSENAFAHYFTIRTRLAFGPEATTSVPGDGSISFGPQGFSVVWEQGQRWEKFNYRELEPPALHGSRVRWTCRHVESGLALYHPWLPAWLEGPRRRRARVFLELLGRVRDGLTPTEITHYQRRLK